MSKQLHNNFTDDQVKSLFKGYLDKKIKINYILQILKIKRGRFFGFLAVCCEDLDNLPQKTLKYRSRCKNLEAPLWISP